jgi:hypothetical protein
LKASHSLERMILGRRFSSGLKGTTGPIASGAGVTGAAAEGQ